VAALLGQDPKRALDDDLVRLKSLLEEGRTRAHGQRVTRDDLADSRRDDVGRTGIWPVSGPLPPGEAPIVDQGDLGHPLVDRRAPETVAAAFITDPVCGTSVEIRLAERCDYNGQAYYFHSIECRRQFDAAPERFTTALDRRRSA
jgi:YHS domain-containing protein